MGPDHRQGRRRHAARARMDRAAARRVQLRAAALELAETADEAVAIAQVAGMPPQNFVVGDRPGNIAWTIAGRLPKRIGDYDARLPADFSKAGTGWDGWLEPRECPADRQSAVAATVDRQPARDRRPVARRARRWRLRHRRAREADSRRPARARPLRAERHAGDPARRSRAVPRHAGRICWRSSCNRAPKSALRERVCRMRLAIGADARRSIRWPIASCSAWRDEVIDTVLDGFAAKVREKFPDFALPTLPQAEHAVWQLARASVPRICLPPGYADWDALLIACADRAAASSTRSTAASQRAPGASATRCASRIRSRARCPRSPRAGSTCRRTRCPAIATCRACSRRHSAHRSVSRSRRATRSTATSCSPADRAAIRSRRITARATRTGRAASRRRSCRDRREHTLLLAPALIVAQKKVRRRSRRTSSR